jgi:hypothetical protein
VVHDDHEGWKCICKTLTDVSGDRLGNGDVVFMKHVFPAERGLPRLGSGWWARGISCIQLLLRMSLSAGHVILHA